MRLTGHQKMIGKKWIEYCRRRSEAYQQGKVVDTWPGWRSAYPDTYHRVLKRWHRDQDIPSKVFPFKAPEKKKSR